MLSSRSSRYFLMNGAPIRAVTFQSMLHDFHRLRLEVVGQDVVWTLQERVRPSGERDVDRRARRYPVGDERLQIVQLESLRLPGREHELHDVVAERILHTDLTYRLA